MISKQSVGAIGRRRNRQQTEQQQQKTDAVKPDKPLPLVHNKTRSNSNKGERRTEVDGHESDGECRAQKLEAEQGRLGDRGNELDEQALVVHVQVRDNLRATQTAQE